MAIAFDSHGSGPPLVLLHGIGSHRGMWAPVVGALARERRVVAVDIPGFAASGAEPVDPTPEGFTTRMQQWFAEQGLGRPHVAGNSMGGAIALELARRGAVASATALSPAGFWTPRELAYAQRSLRASRAIARAARRAMPALCRTAGGRVAVFSQVYAKPWCMRPDEAMAAIDAFADAPAFEPALDRLRPLPLRRGRRAARRAGDRGVGHARRAAHPAPGGSRAAAAAMGDARRRCAAADTCRATTTPRRSRR